MPRFAARNQRARCAAVGRATTPFGKASTMVMPSRGWNGRVERKAAEPSCVNAW
jgi:hypothetical protein